MFSNLPTLLSAFDACRGKLGDDGRRVLFDPKRAPRTQFPDLPAAALSPKIKPRKSDVRYPFRLAIDDAGRATLLPRPQLHEAVVFAPRFFAKEAAKRKTKEVSASGFLT